MAIKSWQSHLEYSTKYELYLQDVRDEIEANDIELGTDVVIDLKVTLEDADKLAEDIGDIKSEMKFYLDGELVLILEEGSTIDHNVKL